MIAQGFTVFETALGAVGLAWSGAGIVCGSLPEREEARQRARFQRRLPGVAEAAPPEDVARIGAAIRRLIGGEKADLSGAKLDLEGSSPFERRVYEIALAIPPGETRTYGEIAAALGDKALSRQVGQALGRNPVPPIVPCHRVLGAGGKTGGFSAPGGVETKMRLLEIERVHAPAGDLFGGLAYQARR